MDIETASSNQSLDRAAILNFGRLQQVLPVFQTNLFSLAQFRVQTTCRLLMCSKNANYVFKMSIYLFEPHQTRQLKLLLEILKLHYSNARGFVNHCFKTSEQYFKI